MARIVAGGAAGTGLMTLGLVGVAPKSAVGNGRALAEDPGPDPDPDDDDEEAEAVEAACVDESETFT